MKFMNHAAFFLVICCISFLNGCGGNPSLKGKVTFADGSPLTVGTVVLDNGSTLSRATIQPDGTFVVGTAKAKDGIPPGTYKVYITGAAEMLDNPEGRFPPPTRQLIHSKHADVKTSGLVVTVEQSNKPLEIQVDPPE